MPVTIVEGIEVHVKFNVYAPDGWHLWCSLWIDGEYLTGDSGPIVADLEDETLINAANEWYTNRTNPKETT